MSSGPDTIVDRASIAALSPLGRTVRESEHVLALGAPPEVTFAAIPEEVIVESEEVAHVRTASNEAWVWDLKRGVLLAREPFDEAIRQRHRSNDDLVVRAEDHGGWTRRALTAWRTGEKVWMTLLPEGLTSAGPPCLVANGDLVAVLLSTTAPARDDDLDEILFLGGADGAPVARLHRENLALNDARIGASPDGALLVVAHRDGRLTSIAVGALTAVDPAAEALWDELMGVDAADEAWDSEFTMSPHDPTPIRARLVALGVRAVPTLFQRTKSGSERARRQAFYGLGELGPKAVSVSAELLALLSAIERDLERDIATRALCSIDFATVLANELDRQERTRLSVADWVVAHRSLEDQRRHFARLIALTPDDQRFVLEGGGWAHLGFKGLSRMPALMDPDTVAALLDSRDEGVKAAAAAALGNARVNLRAPDVLSAFVEMSKLSFNQVEEVAPLPDSDRLVPTLVRARNMILLTLLARRRRHAGRATPFEPMRGLVLEALAKRSSETEREVAEAIELVAELPERTSLSRDVEATRQHAKSHMPFLCDARRRFELACQRIDVAPTLALADALFLSGDVGSWTNADTIYDAVLLGDPTNAYAAFQLAWIARSFGAVIDEGRLGFLRKLGASDDLLAELATPLASPLDGPRSDWAPRPENWTSLERHLARVDRAFAAALPSFAARELSTVMKMLRPPRSRWDKLDDAAKAAIERAIAAHEERRAALERDGHRHVERVRARTRRT